MSFFSPQRIIIIALVLVVFIVGLIAFVLRPTTPIPTPVVETPVPVSQDKMTIGLSEEKRPIEAYVYGTGSTTLLFVGDIHGGYEWNTALLAYKFIDYLTDNPELVSKDLKVIVIPTLNPDGLSAVIGKEGRFVLADVSTNEKILASSRFNMNKVDLNRNFDCKWQPKSTWREAVVSAGDKVFSEPEAVALRDFVFKQRPAGVIFWHSQSGTVYASECEKGILPQTLDIMNVYAKVSGYKIAKTFDSYAISGDADSWLASIGIPAITVELTNHKDIEWDKNLKGIKALLNYFSQG
jgi:predicted deacylase